MKSAAGRVSAVRDVYELPSHVGSFWVQTIYVDDSFGELVRLISGIKRAGPYELHAELERQHRLAGFLPVRELLKRRKVKFLSNKPVPAFAKECPTMRIMGPFIEGGRPTSWTIWKGTRLQNVKTLTQDQETLPILTIMSLPVFIERALKLEGFNPPPQDTMSAPVRNIITHFGYFKTRKNANAAASSLAQFSSTVTSSGERRWLLKIAHPKTASFDEFEESRYRIESVVTRHGGEYDEWTAPAGPP